MVINRSAQPIIIIPSRLSASRLPGKPLKIIAGLPMIIQVIKRAQEANIAPILVAAADQEIYDCVLDYKNFNQENNQVNVLLTDPALQSGSDRINQALQIFDKEKNYNFIINLQGDLPTIDPKLIKTCLAILVNYNFDMSTLAALINNETDKSNPNIVKVVISLNDKTKPAKALYFTRATCPYGVGPLYHHIGIYGYTRDSLERFTALPTSPLELRESLEQLRALENNFTIGVQIVDTIPIGVDTAEDLEKAHNFIIKLTKFP
ncbi:3-deoxy-manno-octulosonate cytidylyltransferase [Candidatus Hepatincolaceae symbiont of Richtersius coronifer]